MNNIDKFEIITSEKIGDYEFSEVLSIIENIEREVIFAGLYGSQNYNIETDKSDFDFVVVVKPSFDDLFNQKSSSYPDINYSKGKIVVKDIRNIFKIFLNGGFNFIEILDSNVNIINEDYKDEIKELFGNKDNIAKINPFKMLKAITGVAANLYEDNNFTTKDMGRMLHYANFIASYINGNSFETCLTSEEIYSKKLIKNLKSKEQTAESLFEEERIIFFSLFKNVFNFIKEVERSYLVGKKEEDFYNAEIANQIKNIFKKIWEKKILE